MSAFLSDLPGLMRPTVPTELKVKQRLSEPVPAAPPAPLAHQRAFVQGWLEKKANWRFAWDRRYVLLDGNRLSYKLDERKPEKGAGTVASLDCQAAALQFTVWLVEGGSWTLRAANLEHFNAWVEALLVALKCDSAGRATQGADRSPARQTHADPDAASTPSHQGQLSSVLSSPGSVTASMVLSPTVVSGAASWSVPQLTAKVMKKGAWTGVWKPRVIELYDGYQLEYKSTGENAAARTRYTITTVDGSFNFNSDRQLFFTTSNGERFWVQFRSRTECAVWYRTVRESLRLNCAWRWLAYPTAVNAEGWSQWFSVASRHAYAAVECQYHAACTGPHPTIRGSPLCTPTVLYVFGGSKEVCRPTFQAAARSCIPFTTPTNVMSGLRLLEIGAANNAETVEIQPFQEHQHAKIRPRGVIGATMSPIAGFNGERGRLVVLGGSTGNVHDRSGATTTELWMAVIGPTPPDDARRIRVVNVSEGSRPTDGATRDAESERPMQGPVWERVLLPNYELPQLTFHAAVSLDLIDEYLAPVTAENGKSTAATAPMSPSVRHGALATGAAVESLTAPDVEPSVAGERHEEEPVVRPSREEQEALIDDTFSPSSTSPQPVSHSVGAPGARATESPQAREHADASSTIARPVVLYSGGLDASFRFRSEVGALVWPSSVPVARASTRSPSVVQPRAVSLGFLPEPRAFHKTTVLEDGTIVLVGGRVLGNSATNDARGAAASTAITVYTVDKTVWKAAIETQLAEDVTEAYSHQTEPSSSGAPISSLPWREVTWTNDPQTHDLCRQTVESVSVVARGHEVYVLCTMQHSTHLRRSEDDDEAGAAVKLLRLTFNRVTPDASTAPRQVRCEEVDIVAGTPPPRTVGATLHFHRNSLYIVGASKRVDDEWSESVRYAILPPYRVLTD